MVSLLDRFALPGHRPQPPRRHHAVATQAEPDGVHLIVVPRALTAMISRHAESERS